MNRCAILSDANRLVVRYLTAADLFQDFRFLAVPIGRQERLDCVAQYFFRAVAEHPLSAAVPAHDSTFKIFADNGVIRRLDDGREQTARLFGHPTLRDVDSYATHTN